MLTSHWEEAVQKGKPSIRCTEHAQTVCPSQHQECRGRGQDLSCRVAVGLLEFTPWHKGDNRSHEHH